MKAQCGRLRQKQEQDGDRAEEGRQGWEGEGREWMSQGNGARGSGQAEGPPGEPTDPRTSTY